jgi:hypothetical protein
MTAGCHDLDTLPRKENSKAIDKDQAFRYYKNAYHGQCIGCHKTMKLEIQQMANTLAGVSMASCRSPAPPVASGAIPKNRADSPGLEPV